MLQVQKTDDQKWAQGRSTTPRTEMGAKAFFDAIPIDQLGQANQWKAHFEMLTQAGTKQLLGL